MKTSRHRKPGTLPEMKRLLAIDEQGRTIDTTRLEDRVRELLLNLRDEVNIERRRIAERKRAVEGVKGYVSEDYGPHYREMGDAAQGVPKQAISYLLNGHRVSFIALVRLLFWLGRESELPELLLEELPDSEGAEEERGRGHA